MRGQRPIGYVDDEVPLGLREIEVEEEQRDRHGHGRPNTLPKLTDNRQDAALKSGHFKPEVAHVHIHDVARQSFRSDS